MQIPPDAVGLDRLGAAKPKIVHATKNTPSTCVKYKMYSVFLFGEALWPQVKYPLGTLCDSLAGVAAAMVENVKGEAPRGVARKCGE